MRELIDVVEGSDNSLSFENDTLTRLDELQGVRNHLGSAGDFRHTGDVITYLTNKGFEYVGHGVYSGVFDHPSFGGRYVLKVFCDRYYEDFLNYAIKNAWNDHLPKVYGKVMPLGENGRMVRIEKLRKFTPADYSATDLGILTEYIWQGLGKHTPEEDRALAHWADRNDLREFAATVIHVIKYKPEGALPDLHAGNFMWRGRTIVLNDPYSGAAVPFQQIKVV
jgi:hypothetical protein